MLVPAELGVSGRRATLISGSDCADQVLVLEQRLRGIVRTQGDLPEQPSSGSTSPRPAGRARSTLLLTRAHGDGRKSECRILSCPLLIVYTQARPGGRKAAVWATPAQEALMWNGVMSQPYARPHLDDHVTDRA